MNVKWNIWIEDVCYLLLHGHVNLYFQSLFISSCLRKAVENMQEHWILQLDLSSVLDLVFLVSL